MKWPLRVQEILDELCQQHPDWVANDEGPRVNELGQEGSPRFELNQMFAEQVCFEMGNIWGLKRADRGRPISSENLALVVGTNLHAWAWENKHNGEWEQYPESEDITGQLFVEVPAINHLNAAPNPEPGLDEPEEPLEDLTEAEDEELHEFMDRCVQHMDRTEKWQIEMLRALDQQGGDLVEAIKNLKLNLFSRKPV